MCFSAPKSPTYTPPPPTATPSDPMVVEALDRERRRQAAMKGRRSTILTGAMGAQPSTAQPRKLLGE